MKKLKDILDSQFEPIKLDEASSFTSFLTEESDYEGPGKIITEEDDPFASASNDAGGDAGGDPFGDAGGGNDAGGDPFGDNAGGGNDADGGGNGGTGSEDGNGDSEGNDDKETSPIDDDSHEDDPEFNQGTGNPDDVTLSDEPSAKVKFNVEKIKTDVELIFNGKILNDEDLEFKNFRNAMFILKKICAKLDIAEANYLNRKMKEPALKKRDQLKQEIAAKKGELAQTRDVLTALDTK